MYVSEYASRINQPNPSLDRNASTVLERYMEPFSKVILDNGNAVYHHSHSFIPEKTSEEKYHIYKCLYQGLKILSSGHLSDGLMQRITAIVKRDFEIFKMIKTEKDEPHFQQYAELEAFYECTIGVEMRHEAEGTQIRSPFFPLQAPSYFPLARSLAMSYPSYQAFEEPQLQRPCFVPSQLKPSKNPHLTDPLNKRSEPQFTPQRPSYLRHNPPPLERQVCAASQNPYHQEDRRSVSQFIPQRPSYLRHNPPLLERQVCAAPQNPYGESDRQVLRYQPTKTPGYPCHPYPSAEGNYSQTENNSGDKALMSPQNLRVRNGQQTHQPIPFSFHLGMPHETREVFGLPTLAAQSSSQIVDEENASPVSARKTGYVIGNHATHFFAQKKCNLTYTDGTYKVFHLHGKYDYAVQEVDSLIKRVKACMETHQQQVTNLEIRNEILEIDNEIISRLKSIKVYRQEKQRKKKWVEEAQASSSLRGNSVCPTENKQPSPSLPASKNKRERDKDSQTPSRADSSEKLPISRPKRAKGSPSLPVTIEEPITVQNHPSRFSPSGKMSLKSILN